MGTLEENTAEVARVAELYRDGAAGTQAATDEDTREALADATHTAVQNEDDGTTLNTENATVAGVVVPVYTDGNVVDIAEPLIHDNLVRQALDGDALFTSGGMVSPSDYIDGMSSYLDMAWVVEASKQTGEKLF